MPAEVAGLIITDVDPSLSDLKDGVRIVTISVQPQVLWLNGSIKGEPYFCSPLAFPLEQWRVFVETMNGTHSRSIANMGINTPSAIAPQRNATLIAVAL